jgi:hypothetical protein
MVGHLNWHTSAVCYREKIGLTADGILMTPIQPAPRKFYPATDLISLLTDRHTSYFTWNWQINFIEWAHCMALHIDLAHLQLLTSNVLHNDYLTKYKENNLALEMNIDWGCLRTRCWGEYFDQRGRNWREAAEHCIIRGFITCMFHQILLGPSNQEEGRWVSLVARTGQMRNAYNILV